MAIHIKSNLGVTVKHHMTANNERMKADIQTAVKANMTAYTKAVMKVDMKTFKKKTLP